MTNGYNTNDRLNNVKRHSPYTVDSLLLFTLVLSPKFRVFGICGKWHDWIESYRVCVCVGFDDGYKECSRLYIWLQKLVSYFLFCLNKKRGKIRFYSTMWQRLLYWFSTFECLTVATRTTTTTTHSTKGGFAMHAIYILYSICDHGFCAQHHKGHIAYQSLFSTKCSNILQQKTQTHSHWHSHSHSHTQNNPFNKTQCVWKVNIRVGW